MKYTDRLLRNNNYLALMNHVKELESDRIYCHHEFEHAVDVCRIAWILYLEETVGKGSNGVMVANMEEMKDHLYVAGLLHDIGRCAQYEEGEHHAKAGARIAAQILAEIEYPEAYTEDIVKIIANHYGRNSQDISRNKFRGDDYRFLGYYIGRADQLSRTCFRCEAISTCKWHEYELNRTLEY